MTIQNHSFAWKWIDKNPDAIMLALGMLSGLLIGCNLMDYENPWNVSGWILGTMTLTLVGTVGIMGIIESMTYNKPWSIHPLLQILGLCYGCFCLGEILVLGVFFHHADISLLSLYWAHIQFLWKPFFMECMIVGILGAGIVFRIWAEQSLGNLD